MFNCEDDLLVNLVVLTPKLARRKFRQHIFEAWGWRCAYCDKELGEHTATIDHIVPKHKGGQNVRSNMICSCGACNKSKSTFDWKFWFQEKDFFCKDREEKIEKWISESRLNIELRFSSGLHYL